MCESNCHKAPPSILEMIFHKRNFLWWLLEFSYTFTKINGFMGFIVMHGKLFFPFVNGSKPRINVAGPPQCLFHNKACSRSLYDNLIHTFVVQVTTAQNQSASCLHIPEKHVQSHKLEPFYSSFLSKAIWVIQFSCVPKSDQNKFKIITVFKNHLNDALEFFNFCPIKHWSVL